MDTRKLAADYRLMHWAQVMRERTEKGLSVREYCEVSGIPENTYFYWQRKLREAACTGMQSTATDEKSLVPSGWTSLRVKEDATHTRDLTVEVSGCRITVSRETDTELLIKVCRALKAL